MNSLEARLLEVEARAQISELRAKYSWFIIRGMNDDIADLFTENGIFEYPLVGTDGKRRLVEGREAIRKHFMNRDPAARVPIIANEIVEINGNEAKGTCLMFTPFSPTRANGIGGYYHERFACEAGRWRFTERRYYLYWPVFERPPASVA